MRWSYRLFWYFDHPLLTKKGIYKNLKSSNPNNEVKCNHKNNSNLLIYSIHLQRGHDAVIFLHNLFKNLLQLLSFHQDFHPHHSIFSHRSWNYSSLNFKTSCSHLIISTKICADDLHGLYRCVMYLTKWRNLSFKILISSIKNTYTY